MIPESATYDCLIVGQGLAGTILAHELDQRGYSFRIIDNGHRNACSMIAAGVMNPITGRRFVKSWMYDQLYPKALEKYKQLEQKLDCKLIQQCNIIRIFRSPGQETEWLARSAWPGHQEYVVDEVQPGAFLKIGDPSWRYGEVRHSYQIDIPQIVGRSKQIWLSDGALHIHDFRYNELTFNDHIIYQDEKYNNVIFCEGQQARFNPYFRNDLLAVSRGDILIVRIPNLNLKKIVKKKYFLIQLEGDLFWYGALNSWDDTDIPLQEKDRNELMDHLHQMIKLPFTVVEHKAAIRPTVQDRRPILGKHPEIQNMFIFNGLGTKGASIGPYWADKLVSYMYDAGGITDEVDVKRFYAGK